MWRKNNEEFNAKETKKQMAQRDARKAMVLFWDLGAQLEKCLEKM